MSEKYTYLFPYEKVPYGSRIIYGAGDVGQEYLQQMLMTDYAEVLCFLDRAFDKYPAIVIPIFSPEKVVELTFDYIIIATKTSVLTLACLTSRSAWLLSKGTRKSQKKQQKSSLYSSSRSAQSSGNIPFSFPLVTVFYGIILLALVN